MSVVDDRIVRMQLDNKQFEANAKKTLATLSNIDRGLKVDNLINSFKRLETSSKQVSLGHIASSVDNLVHKFSFMGRFASRTFDKIANNAISSGKRLIGAFTIDPIKTGFAEYETQINAIQTILANTRKEGATIDDVNAALGELNEYADKTIYNFTEMTRNVGTFTSAGIDLKTSTTAIKGFSNVAAMSGVASTQASNAMFQLSQAMSAGKVQLLDWMSIEKAGMASDAFKNELVRTAKVMGINYDKILKKQGSFRETLKEGWLTAEVMTETLAKFTGDLNEEQLLAKGYTKEETEEILKLGETANDAATKVKTFTQLFDTLKEAAQSGWTQSWQYVIGDFEEAKELLTGISDSFGAIIEKQSAIRNEALKTWKTAGGRYKLIESFKNIFSGIYSIASAIHNSFRDIFGKDDEIADKANLLTKLTNSFYKFSQSFKNFFSFERIGASFKTGEDGISRLVPMTEKASTFMGQLKRTLDGVFSLIKTVYSAIATIVGYIYNTITGSSGISGVFSVIAESIAKVGDFLVNLQQNIEDNDLFGYFISQVDSLRQAVSDKLPAIFTAVSTWFGKIKTALFGESISNKEWNFFDNFSENIVSFAGKVKQFGKDAIKFIKESKLFKTVSTNIGKALTFIETHFVDGIQGAKEFFKSLKDNIKSFSENTKVFDKVSSFLSETIEKIKILWGKLKEAFQNLTADDNFSGESFKEFFIGKIQGITQLPDQIKEFVSGKLDSIKTGLSEVLTGIGSFASSMWEKAHGIFESIGTFVSGIDYWAIIDKGLAAYSIVNLVRFVKSLTGFIKSITKLSKSKEPLIKIDKITNKLPDSIKNIITKTKDADKKTGASIGTTLLQFAASLAIIVGALYLLSKIKMDENFEKSLTVLGGIAGMLTVMALVVSKFGKGGSIGIGMAASILAVVYAVQKLIGPLIILSGMDRTRVIQGVGTLSALIIALSSTTLGRARIGSAVTILAAAKAMQMLLPIVLIFSNMDPKKMYDGVIAVGGIVFALGLLNVMSMKSSFKTAASIMAAAIAIRLLIEPIQILSRMEAEKTLSPGMIALFGLLTVLGALIQISKTHVGQNSKITGMLLAFAFATYLLIPPLKILSKMKWEELAKAGFAITMLVASLSVFSNFTKGVGWAAVASMAVLAGLIDVMAWAFIRTKNVPVKNMLTFSLGLSACFLSFAGAMNILRKIPLLGAIKGIAILGIIVIGLAAAFTLAANIAVDTMQRVMELVFVAGSVISDFTDLTSGVNESTTSGPINALKDIYEFLTSIWFTDVGSVELFLSTIVPLGAKLNLFSILVSGIDPSVSATARTLADDIYYVIDKFGQAAGKVTDLDAVSTQITEIGSALKLYADSISDINTDENSSVAKSDSISKLIGGLVENLPENSQVDKISSFASELTDGDTLTDFGIGLTSLGTALKSYSTSVEGINNTAVEDAQHALNLLSDLQEKLPTEGGIWETFHGKQQTLDQFGEDIAALGGALSSYATSVEGIDSTKVTNSVGALDILNRLQTELPNSGGLLGWIKGDQDLTEFGSKLGTVGDGLKQFADAVTGLDEEDVSSATIPLDMLAQIQSRLQESGGVAQWFIGSQDIGTFGKNLETFGTHLAGFVSSVTGITMPTNMADIVSLADSLTSFQSKLNDSNTFGKDLGSINLEKFAQNISAFVDVTKEIDSTNADNIIALITAINMIFENNQTMFYNSGIDIITQLVNGMNSNPEVPTTAMNGIIIAMSDQLDNSQAFYNSGMYIIQGLARGISDNAWVATAAAWVVGKQTISALNSAAKIASPSKASYSSGRFISMGAGYGIMDNAYYATDAASKLGLTIIDSLSHTADMVQAIINSDDSFAPTITPVLDLTNVTNGAALVNSMFGNSQVGLNAKVTSIADSFGRNTVSSNQNGIIKTDNRDVVDAISRLSGRVDSLGEAITNMQIVMDTGATVGQLAPEIDRHLGRNMVKNERRI